MNFWYFKNYIVINHWLNTYNFIPFSITWGWREEPNVFNQGFPIFQQRQWWCRRSSMSRGRSHWLTLTTCLGPSDLASPATEALLHLVTRPSTVYLETDWCSVDKMRRYKRVKNKSSTCTNVEPGKVPLGISEKCTTKCMIIKTW